MIVRIFCLWLNFACTLSCVFAQWDADVYLLKQLSVNEGLSHSDVTAMVQDDLGYLWIGTNNGLNRYDGKAVRIFKADPFDQSSLPDSKITALYKDSRGYVWVGTQFHGLCYYNPQTATFKQVELEDVAGGRQATVLGGGLRVSAIAEAHDGMMWVGTREKGVFLLSIDKHGQAMAEDHILQKFSYNQTVDAIVFVSDDEVIFSTYSALYSFNYRSGATFKIELPDGIGLPRVLSDRKGGLFIGGNTGLYSVRKKGGQSGAYSVTRIRLSQPISNITSLFLDSRESLWLGTFGQGLYQVKDLNKKSDGEATVVEIANSSVSKNFTGAIARVNCIVEDKYGLLWIGSSAGGAAYFSHRNRFFKLISNRFGKQYLPTDYVTGFYAGKEYLWVGTRKGLALLQPDKKPQYSFVGIPITSLEEDHAGWLWVGTNGHGIKKVRFIDGQVSHASVPTTEGLSPRLHVTGIREDARHRLWVGTFNEGIKILSSDRRSVRQLKRFDQVSGLSSNLINYIYCDPAYPLVWVATRDAGVDCFSIDSGKLVLVKNFRRKADSSGLSSNFAWPIVRSDDSTIWVGTLGGGLNRIVGRFPGPESISHVTTRNGLRDNDVEAMELDQQGNLWIGGYGLTKFSTKNGAMQFFDHHDGLQSNAFKVGASHRDKAGMLYFGGVDGFNYFLPDSVGRYISPPDMVLTGVNIFDETITPGEAFQGKKILSKPLHFTDTLVLPATLNDFTLTFTAIQLAGAPKVHYYFMLEGYHDKYVESSVPSASFSNLEDGLYRFRVKAAVNNLYSEEKILTIQILPPWWHTWWAYILYAAAIFSSLVIYRRILTNRNKLKNELALAEKDKSLNEEKLEFFTNISHELKTPLSLIYSPLTELMESEETLSADASKEKLWLIYRNSERLMALANQLIDFKKMESSRLTLNAAKGDIIQFIKEIWLLFRHQAESMDISYHFSTEEPSVSLYFDREKLQLVFSNLFMNAFRYTPRGGSVLVNIYIKGNQEEAAKFDVTAGECVLVDNYLEVVVEDNGVGIAEHELNRIFDAHYHAAVSNSLQAAGTGLGLSIARRVIEQHKGFIKVESRLGSGSRFIVGIPFGKAHLSSTYIIDDYISPDDVSHYRDADPGAPPEPEYKPSGHEGGCTLLIVEDHIALLNYLADVFSRYFNVITAKNGREGLEKARQLLPDLIISDVMMPEMDGLEMCRTLKRDVETDFIPIILLTARTAALYELEGIATGADDYISKPFNVNLLKAKINNYLHNRIKVKEYYRKLMAAEDGKPAINTADEVFIHRVIDTVEQHLQDKMFGVSALASELAMSKSALFKRLKDVTGVSPVDFIRSLRLKKAEELLREGHLTVSEVALTVGISDLKYFREQFRRRTGILPSEYLRKAKQDS